VQQTRASRTYHDERLEQRGGRRRGCGRVRGIAAFAVVARSDRDRRRTFFEILSARASPRRGTIRRVLRVGLGVLGTDTGSPHARVAASRAALASGAAVSPSTFYARATNERSLK